MVQVDTPDQAIAASAMRKTMWRILPLILLAYVMAYMDRVNVSFAALRMNDDLKFTATIYGLGSGLFFLGYAVFEVPSSLMLRRFSAPQWLARIMITWGLLSAGTMFVRTPVQFYAMRFLLGVAEAGFFPSMIYYFSGWFPMAWRGRAVGRIYVAAPLAGTLMGVISPSLLALDGTGGLRGWQWLFIAQGLPSVFIGLVLWRFLPETPATSAWLTGQEKHWIASELRRDLALIGAPVRPSIFAAFRNPMVVLLGLAGLLANCAGNGLQLYAPAMLAAGTGFDTQHIGNIVSLGGLSGAVAVVIAGWRSDRRGDRFPYAAGGAFFYSAAMLAIALTTFPVVVVVAYVVFMMAFVVTASLLVASWADVLHISELAVGGAAINTMWQIGAFLSPYGWGIARDATGGFQAGLLGSAAIALALGVLIIYIRWRVISARRMRARVSASGSIA